MPDRSKPLSTRSLQERIIKNWRLLLERKEAAACVLIFDNEFKVLLCRRKANTAWMPEKWGFPGGGVEEGETAEQAAIREIKEETNLDIHHIQQFHQNPYCVFFATRKYDGIVELSDEHTDYEWVSQDRLQEFDLIPGNEQIIDKALSDLYGR